MNRFLRVATIALLLVGFTSTAFAQAADSTAAGGGESGDDAAKKPCHLTMEHYEALNTQIAELRTLIDALKEELAATGETADSAPEGTKNEEVVGSPESVKGVPDEAEATTQRHELQAELHAANERLAELQAELKEANRQLASLIELQRSGQPAPYASWHWGVGVRGGLAMLTNDEDHSAGLGQVFGLARWVDNSHLGVEVTTAIGAWPTGDSAPLMLSGRAAGIATWESWGLSLGPEVSFLATPLKGKEGGNVLTTLLFGGEVHVGGFLAQALLGPTLHSEMKRTSGFWGVLGLCYYY